MSEYIDDFSPRYEEGKGFVIGGLTITSFYPEVTKVIKTLNINTGEETTQYEVKVRYKDGEESPPCTVNNLNKIDWFEAYNIFEDISSKDSKRLTSLLRKEAIECANIEQKVLAPSGFYLTDAGPYQVMGDCVVKPDGFREDMRITPKPDFEIKRNPPKSEKDINDTIENFLSFMPDVSELLFYVSLLGVIKPILVANEKIVDFFSCIVAPSGHLKTTLAKTYALYLKNKEEQIIDFADTIRSDVLQKRLGKLKTQNFLIDDYHAVSKSYTRQKYKERLDMAVRGGANFANIIFTAEALEKGDAIFSAMDRLLYIDIKLMSADEILSYKNKLSTLAGYDMSEVAIYFVQKLLDNYEKVIDRINGDGIIKVHNQKPNRPDWDDGSTRMGNVYDVMLLVENLFCEFVCNGDKEHSHHKDFVEALNKTCAKHSARLKRQRAAEQKYDYIVLLNEMILDGAACEELGIKLTTKEYNDAGGENRVCAFREKDIKNGSDKLYITGNALAASLRKRTGQHVSLKKVSDELHDAGILIEDLDKRSKKFEGRRHYVLDLERLKEYSSLMV